MRFEVSCALMLLVLTNTVYYFSIVLLSTATERTSSLRIVS